MLPCTHGRFGQQHINLAKLEYSMALLIQTEKPWEPLTLISLWRSFCYKSLRHSIRQSLKIMPRAWQNTGYSTSVLFVPFLLSLSLANSHPLADLQRLQAHIQFEASAEAGSAPSQVCLPSHGSLLPLLFLPPVRPTMTVFIHSFMVFQDTLHPSPLLISGP